MRLLSFVMFVRNINIFLIFFLYTIKISRRYFSSVPQGFENWHDRSSPMTIGRFYIGLLRYCQILTLPVIFQFYSFCKIFNLKNFDG